MGTHPDPDQFVTELITDDSAADRLPGGGGPQPPAARGPGRSAEHQHPGAHQRPGRQRTDRQRAGRDDLAGLGARERVCPADRVRTVPLPPVVRRGAAAEAKREHPDRMAPLHRRAARWYERNGQLTDAVRHAAQAGDWQLAASIVIDQLAISEIIEPRGGPCLAGEFGGMPHGQAWTEPQPHLVSAAIALSAGRHAVVRRRAGCRRRHPGASSRRSGDPSRLAAAMIRLTASLRTRGPGDGGSGRCPRRGAGRQGSRATSSPGIPYPGARCCLAAGRSSCGQAISTRRPVPSSRGWPPRPLRAGRANERTAWGIWRWSEALRGRLGRAATLAAQATAALHGRRAAAARPAPQPRGTCRTGLGAPGTQ